MNDQSSSRGNVIVKDISKRGRAIDVLCELGERYLNAGFVKQSVEVFHDESHVHGFYQSVKYPDKFVHVDVHLGPSTDDYMFVSANTKSNDGVLKARRTGTLPGREFSAVDNDDDFKTLRQGITMPYDTKSLDEKIGQECKWIIERE